jgi:hypothetical protein
VCLVAVPSETSDDVIEVYEFEKQVLEDVFNKALAEMKGHRKAPTNEIPIFVPLDKRTSRSLGHSINNAKELGKLHLVNVSDLAQFKGELDRGFVARVRREFAELIGVEVSKVVVEFRVSA